MKKNASQSQGNLASLIPLTQGQCSDLAEDLRLGRGSEADPTSYMFPLDLAEEDLKTGHRDAKDAMAPATVLTDNEFLLQAFGHSRASYRLLRH